MILNITSRLTRERFSVTALTLSNFFTIDHHVAWRFDADPHLGAIDRHDGYFDLFTDAQSFAGATCKYEHACIYARAA